MISFLNRNVIVGIAAAGLLLGANAAVAADWNADLSHTEVNFSVNHFFTPVSGSFHNYTVEMKYDAEKPANSSVKVVIPVSTVDTGNEKRNGHLMSPDFFEAEKYPNITFESTKVVKTEKGMAVTGNLTIKETTKEVTLDVVTLGVSEIPEAMQANFGMKVASFRASTKINRNDFGVGVGNWAATLVIGGEVDIEILLEASYR